MPESLDSTQRAVAVLEDEALTSHAVYAADSRHPVEVLGDERDHLRQWLSDRLNRNVAAPDLSQLGYRLLGGRLLATDGGRPAALFMYEDSNNQRLSVVVRPMSPGMHVAEFEMGQGRTNGCGWIGNGLGYAVVAALSDSELDHVADSIKARLPNEAS
jgi:anti-sigma factor RsiW